MMVLREEGILIIWRYSGETFGNIWEHFGTFWDTCVQYSGHTNSRKDDDSTRSSRSMGLFSEPLEPLRSSAKRTESMFARKFATVKRIEKHHCISIDESLERLQFASDLGPRRTDLSTSTNT